MSEDESEYETENELEVDSASMRATNSREETLSATSSIAESTVYSGAKGKLHRKQSRPRSRKN